MSQMPLWGEPNEEPWAAKTEKDKVVITKHTGPPTTCHLCTIDVARGGVRHERDLTSHVARGYGRVWLMCRAHTREVRERTSLLEKYKG